MTELTPDTATTGATFRKVRNEHATAYVVVEFARETAKGKHLPGVGLHRFYMAPSELGPLPLRISQGPTTWHGSVAEARAGIPHTLRRLERDDCDAAWIVETWL